jgi:predicted enzyme related to lactoylglutathione lyase
MIRGLRVASIWSEDLNNLLPFYRDVVGLPVGMETPGFVVMGDPNAPAVALGTHSEVRGRASDPERHITGFETDDLDAEFTRLKGQGVEFIEEPSAQGDGAVRVATFKDPEGNLLQLLQFSGRM